MSGLKPSAYKISLPQPSCVTALVNDKNSLKELGGLLFLACSPSKVSLRRKRGVSPLATRWLKHFEIVSLGLLHVRLRHSPDHNISTFEECFDSEADNLSGIAGGVDEQGRELFLKRRLT
jgi:hypothetical protein